MLEATALRLLMESIRVKPKGLTDVGGHRS